MQWRTLIPKGGGLIHMDFDGLPPIPTSSFWHFLSLVVCFPSFRVPFLWGHFEALNNVFRSHDSQKFPLIDCRKMCRPQIDIFDRLSCA
jgi:hypothetical protein